MAAALCSAVHGCLCSRCCLLLPAAAALHTPAAHCQLPVLLLMPCLCLLFLWRSTPPHESLTPLHAYKDAQDAGADCAAPLPAFQVRGYLAICGGLDVPVYLGSRATFPGGNFGGYQGRFLQTGDSLPIGHGGASHPITMPQVGLLGGNCPAAAGVLACMCADGMVWLSST